MNKIKFENRKAKCFTVSAKEIRKNNYDLSISKYKETEYEEKVYEKPEEIKSKILDYEKKIIEVLKDLKV